VIILKISPYSLDRVSNSVLDFFYVCVCYIKNKIQQSVDWSKILQQKLNLVPTFCYYIAYPAHFSFIFFQPTISSKSSLLLLQELPTGNLFFDRSKTDPYSPLSSYQLMMSYHWIGVSTTMMFTTEMDLSRR
jgi:hypothetical protein